ncbi:MAG: nucleotidyltransferase family protein [Gammaproteobacteria bacterium]|nr:nucleotidyltransferase family protein [Gammaproteobacteria bacterium]
MSRLANQLTEAVLELRAAGARFALIGGLALAAHKVVRGTQDIDLLVDGDQSDQIDALLRRLGYRSIHRSADAANYLRGSERVDLLYAVRPAARLLLEKTGVHATVLGDIPVISCEGLIAFKLQALVNNPSRTQDLEDMRALLHANRAQLDMDELRGYFRLFDREALLNELMS